MNDDIKNMIQNEIDNNEVCLFMKGTPDAPQCGFSMAVSNMLKILEVNFKGINVLENQELREGIKVFSDWPTIPQLYIKKEFVGGCDIVKEMYENGELKQTLEAKGINFKK
ncbi:Grx4 family monothiol glutaredoxin [Candidatus Pelagibacter sp.]|jgi:monothiol glutaredoxin|uniref:Grx4 family monothiol glutaredoxin n=1 Tax=Candidatus Pelagibacter sp. TaxID=2024849 RepID=UPI003F84367B